MSSLFMAVHNLDSPIYLLTNSPLQTMDNNTMRPVTIKQILDATQAHPEANYQIDGADIGSLYFVGQVRNISSQTTNITYKIDDGTGEIEAKLWVDLTTEGMEDNDNMDVDGTTKAGLPKKAKVELNGFVKVFGKLKSFGNKRYLGAHTVRPLTDINEFHYHFLEATAVHLFFTRGPPRTAGGAGAGAGDAKGAAAGIGADPYGAAAGGQGRTLPAMSPAARRVFNLLKSEPQSNEGLHMQLIAAKLNLPVTDVAKAGDELLTSGLIFSTVDEHTWAILEY
jgi:replication factor A2